MTWKRLIGLLLGRPAPKRDAARGRAGGARPGASRRTASAKRAGGQRGRAQGRGNAARRSPGPGATVSPDLVRKYVAAGPRSEADLKRRRQEAAVIRAYVASTPGLDRERAAALLEQARYLHAGFRF